MDTLQVAYEILYSLEHKEKPKYMGQIVSPEALKVDPEKWLEVVQSLLEEGYVSGVTIRKTILGETRVDIANARITLSGAEYLKENSVMRKIAKIATDVITIAK